jgi:predicted 3-demethylubiquinone-9 3-methyltransferase (glyoxalase superfamily)
MVSFTLNGLPFEAISAGPYLTLNPSISLLVYPNTLEEAQKIWDALSENGQTMMPFAKYPFAEMYGWCNDRFGLSWQIMYEPNKKHFQYITPTIMFSDPNIGKAEEAITEYLSIFPKSTLQYKAEYNPGESTVPEAKIKHAGISLCGYSIALFDSGNHHSIPFDGGFSFMVSCKDQAEIDYFWQKLSHVPEAEQCGWCKDRFGISWQIVPKTLGDMMSAGTAEQKAAVTQAFLKMKKFDVAELERAFEGK